MWHIGVLEMCVLDFCMQEGHIAKHIDVKCHVFTIEYARGQQY